MANRNFIGCPATAYVVQHDFQSDKPFSENSLAIPDSDPVIHMIDYDDSPLLRIMMEARTVKVNSPIVNHYNIPRRPASLKTIANVSATNYSQVVLPLESKMQNVVRPFDTLLVKDVDGFSEDGQNRTIGKSLLLFVVDHDPSTNNPIVRSINGPRNHATDEFTSMPRIPAGSLITILSNTMYETQLEVDPVMNLPQAKKIYLQKRGMNSVVSDYFDAQLKRVDFGEAHVAEYAIQDFKDKSTKTLWASRPGMFRLNVPNLGIQYVYNTEGIRWQIQNIISLNYGDRQGWTFDKIIAVAKLFFTSEDSPSHAVLLAGKNLLANIQTTDFSAHPEVSISNKTNRYGWSVSSLHTVFGDIEIIHDYTLDDLGWADSGAIIAPELLTRYVLKDQSNIESKVCGQEARRNAVIVWDALALRGSCHIWIDGETTPQPDSDNKLKPIVFWNSPEAPTIDEARCCRFYLLRDCPAMAPEAEKGQLWHGFASTIGTDADVIEVVKWQKFIPTDAL